MKKQTTKITYPKFGLAKTITPILIVIMLLSTWITQIILSGSIHVNQSFNIFLFQYVSFAIGIIINHKFSLSYIKKFEKLANLNNE